MLSAKFLLESERVFCLNRVLINASKRLQLSMKNLKGRK